MTGTALSGERVTGSGFGDYYSTEDKLPRGLAYTDKSVSELDPGQVEPFGSFEIAKMSQAQLIMPETRLGAGGSAGLGDPNMLEGSGIGDIYIAAAESSPVQPVAIVQVMS